MMQHPIVGWDVKGQRQKKPRLRPCIGLALASTQTSRFERNDAVWWMAWLGWR
jgi:hypothetical protein